MKTAYMEELTKLYGETVAADGIYTREEWERMGTEARRKELAKHKGESCAHVLYEAALERFGK